MWLDYVTKVAFAIDHKGKLQHPNTTKTESIQVTVGQNHTAATANADQQSTSGGKQKVKSNREHDVQAAAMAVRDRQSTTATNRRRCRRRRLSISIDSSNPMALQTHNEQADKRVSIGGRSVTSRYRVVSCTVGRRTIKFVSESIRKDVITQRKQRRKRNDGGLPGDADVAVAAVGARGLHVDPAVTASFDRRRRRDAAAAARDETVLARSRLREHGRRRRLLPYRATESRHRRQVSQRCISKTKRNITSAVTLLPRGLVSMSILFLRAAVDDNCCCCFDADND